MTYFEASEKLGKKDSKKVGNNTYLVRRSPTSVAIKLHNTDVVTLTADGLVILNSGGWHTVTTKARINEFAPVSVWQKNFAWFVNKNYEYSPEKAVSFFDGIIFNVNTGEFTNV